MAGEEGWYTDPYGRHQARWFSDGKPTKLVRDGQVEAYDELTDELPSSVPMPLVPDVALDHGADLKRADEVEQRASYDREGTREEAWESFPEFGPSD